MMEETIARGSQPWRHNGGALWYMFSRNIVICVTRFENSSYGCKKLKENHPTSLFHHGLLKVLAFHELAPEKSLLGSFFKLIFSSIFIY